MKGLAHLIQDPLFVLDIKGVVLEYNRHARALLGRSPLGDQVFEPDKGFKSLVEAASGSSEPVIGAVTLRSAWGDPRRFRVRGLVIDRSDAEFRIAVQVMDVRDDQFTLLTRRVKDLNREVANRQAIQARLEESLAQNGMLYRELQHRVKNHLQMMLGLFTAARRETSQPEDLALLDRMQAKLQAVFEAQRLMYEHDSRGVWAEHLLSSIANVIRALAADGVQIDIQADPVTISNDVAFPVALIVNELLSNAVKYGTPGGTGRISVSLNLAGDDIELQVRDWGPGFLAGESNRRSSGLGLVRGLCRQIGGRVQITSEGGTHVRVHFPTSG